MYDIMVNQRPDLTFTSDDIVKIRDFKRNNKFQIFDVHMEDSLQGMLDEVLKWQDPFQVFVQQKPEEIYNENGELFLTLQHVNIIKNMFILNNFLNSDTTHKLTKSRLNTLACGSVDCQQVYHLGCIAIARHETNAEYRRMYRSLDEEVHKLSSIKREETLTRSMNDNDDAIFSAIKDQYFNPQLVFGNCYFHLSHRSKSLKAAWTRMDELTKSKVEPMLEYLHRIQIFQLILNLSCIEIVEKHVQRSLP